MKKNQIQAWLLVILMIGQLGFEWGAQSGEKKNVPAHSSTSIPRERNVPFPQMMGALSQNMTLWPTLSQDNKKSSVEAAILLFRNRQNSAILRPAEFYVAQIDEAIQANSTLQKTDLMTMVKMMSVMQYDFYNGQNKDALAKEVLGEEMAKTVRARRQPS